MMVVEESSQGLPERVRRDSSTRGAAQFLRLQLYDTTRAQKYARRFRTLLPDFCIPPVRKHIRNATFAFVLTMLWVGKSKLLN
jgi:hypothetical protein